MFVIMVSIVGVLFFVRNRIGVILLFLLKGKGVIRGFGFL